MFSTNVLSEKLFVKFSKLQEQSVTIYFANCFRKYFFTHILATVTASSAMAFLLLQSIRLKISLNISANSEKLNIKRKMVYLCQRFVN